MPLLQGETVDRYVIEGLLGAGGMGQVYRAYDPRLERMVALKIVSPADGASPSARDSDGTARLRREARAAAALDHPSVVAVYDVGEIASGPLQGTTYIAMELVKGESLRRYVGDPSVTIDERVRWLTDVARALAAAHHAGIVHRDVKPENVMIRQDGLAKVLDFGIAKRAQGAAVDPTSSTEHATTAGVVLGTPVYMAPEQLRGEPLDGRADQFAWGVLAYELLAGRAPWSRDKGTFALVSEILHVDPERIDSIADVPPLVAAAVTRALRKDPARRFGSMDELLEALGGVFARRPSKPPTPETATVGPQGTEREGVMALATPPAREEPVVTPAIARDPVASTARSRVDSAPAKPRWARAAIGAASLAVLASAAGAIVATSRARSREATAPPAAPAPGCTGHRACIAAHGGEPWVCRASDHACVPVASEDCVAHFDPDDLASDDTVWLGAMLPLSGPRAEAYGTRAANVLELARRDFGTVGGILAGGDAKLRRLALVVCDDANARRAAEHLAEVGVPAVLGPAATLKETIDVATNVFVPRGTLVVDLFHESPLITRIPQPAGTPRLVWRLTSSAEGDGEALAHVVSDRLEPLRRDRSGPLRVAIIRSDADTPTQILNAFLSSLRIDGTPLVQTTGAFRPFTFSGGTISPDAARAIADDVVAFAPDVVAYTEGYLIEDSFVDAIERGWRRGPRPFYVSEGPFANPKLAAFLGADAERRHRFVAVDLPANTDANFEFVNHYNERFDPKITPGMAPGVVYDAFYVAAYAASAVREPRITGAAIAAGLARFGGDGAAITVGPSRIFGAYEVLRRGERLHLVGAGSQLDLDTSTGELSSDYAVYCFGVDRHGRASEPIESGLRFDHRAKRIVGTWGCP